MLENYDKDQFEIVDLYDMRLSEYEQVRQETHDWQDWEEGISPEQYKKELLGDLERGQEYLLVRYTGNAESVKVPSGVTKIERYVFRNKTALRSVYIPDTVTAVSEYLFEGCTALENVRLGKYTVSIGFDAFKNCKSLKNIELPEPLKTISLNSFKGSGLESIYIPKNVERIDASAFMLCNSLERSEVDPDNPHYYCRDNCLYHTKNGWLILGRNDGALPDDGSFNTIFSDAFRSNLKVKDISIPQGVEHIYSSAFQDCKNLKRVTLPNTLVSIDPCAFHRCAALEEVTVPGSVKVIERFAFGESGLKKVVIKRGVTEIGECAFFKCANLREVYIPATVESCGWRAFDGCDKSMRVYIETGAENNYERRISEVRQFDVVLGCKAEVFD